MKRARVRLCLMAVAVGTLALTALAGLAAQEQAGSTKPVAFATADGVKLKGTLYPGGKAGSTVVMLHAVGEDSSKKEYQNLAKKLQTAGYSVLTFDFRGHGQSTTVEPGMPNFNPKLSIPGFWDEIENQRGVRGYNAKKRPTEIDQKQFTPAYHRILVNDIAAAVNHLEESGEASNLVLLGAGDGATLGALWLNSEWHRYKLLPPQPPKFRTPRPDLQNPEGQRVRAAVWLSISDKLGSQNVSVSGLLDVAARQKQTPMIFFYADGDEKGKKIALAAEKALKTDKKNQEFLIAYKIKDAEKLTGRNLLVDSLGTDRLILSYLKNALEGRLNQAKASSGKSEDAPYIWQWQTRTGQVMQRPARQRGANFILFSTYDVFLR